MPLPGLHHWHSRDAEHVLPGHRHLRHLLRSDKEFDPEDDPLCWIKELCRGCESDFHVILAGTKYDLWEEGSGDCVAWEDVCKVAKAIGACVPICTSTETGYGVMADGGEPDTKLLSSGIFLKDAICKIMLAKRDRFVSSCEDLENL